LIRVGAKLGLRNLCYKSYQMFFFYFRILFIDLFSVIVLFVGLDRGLSRFLWFPGPVPHYISQHSPGSSPALDSLITTPDLYHIIIISSPAFIFCLLLLPHCWVLYVTQYCIPLCLLKFLCWARASVCCVASEVDPCVISKTL